MDAQHPIPYRNDDLTGPAGHAVYVDGRVRVCSHLCSTCVFRRGNLMRLEPGRLARMVAEANADEAGSIVCHSTLAESLQAVCRGYWDRHRHGLLVLAERVGIVVEVDPPSLLH